MILTFFYMYATFLQWWRLGALKNKLKGTLNASNALLVCDDAIIYETKKSRSFENLLFRLENRVGCTVVPKQKINLSQWLTFPHDLRLFPIYFESRVMRMACPKFYVVLQAMLDTYIKHPADILEIENFGELVAWRATDSFEVILKTDLDRLSKLVNCFRQGDLDINHELKLLRIETVDVEGVPTKIKYDQKFPKENVLKYSYLPRHWQKFSDSLRQIYSRIRDNTPKITIENGRLEETRRVPVSEVKPMKKDGKNTLDVAAGDHRRHKKDKNSDRHSRHSDSKGDSKVKDVRTRENEKEGSSKSSKAKTSKPKEDSKKNGADSVNSNGKVLIGEAIKTLGEAVMEFSEQKDAKPFETRANKTAKEYTVVDSGKSEPDSVKNSEKKLTKSTEVFDETLAPKNDEEEYPKMSNGGRNVKPPNILVYADSPVAKENVKTTLSSMLNKEKYAIYDLPTDPNQSIWNDTTVLVVICGNVPPNLTFHLLQYLVTGGQLLCLCSDFLYSVLHTFTTAEVREHELVRFTYGKWKQVKMMHHIFCYQASPAKKQFSKESDHSQSSGNSSSPIAPRTPSAVEIQHNGKEYIIQVQVLGTEETWQTPSLLSASVKGGEGRAIFSQVHLEINPDEYEGDESKFEALKDSDKARMEILKDILTNRLDLDCSFGLDVDYTPAYFLGRHEVKLKVLNECGDIEENTLVCEKVLLKFCGKDVVPDDATSSIMPVLIHSCPSNFSTVNYFEEVYYLKAKVLTVQSVFIRAIEDKTVGDSVRMIHELIDKNGTIIFFYDCHEISSLLYLSSESWVLVGKMMNKIKIHDLKNQVPQFWSTFRTLKQKLPENSLYLTGEYVNIALETEHIGRLVIYSDVMASSQNVVAKSLAHGLVVIPRQQTQGIGRSNNVWISPMGCAMFSMQLHISRDTTLGKYLPLTQQIGMVAVISALKSISGSEELNIGLKWPNDLYANGSIKIGGLLITSTVSSDVAIVNIGCGINLDNGNPTICVNDMIRISNETKGTSMKRIAYETYFAGVFNETERIMKIVQSGNIDYLYDLYYKYWLHNDSEVVVTSSDGNSERVKIVGIDDYGFLRVRTATGKITSVHSDGNTFDMLKGLIFPKSF